MSHPKSSDIKKLNVKFIYSYFNIFTLVINNDSLYIIINNKKKPNNTTKWHIDQNQNIISDDLHNKKIEKKYLENFFKPIKLKGLNILSSDDDTIKHIYINKIKYTYKTNSIYGKTLQILKTTYLNNTNSENFSSEENTDNETNSFIDSLYEYI